MHESRRRRFSVVEAALVLLALASNLAATEVPDLKLSNDRPLRAGFLLVDGIYNTELMAPWDVFQHTRYHSSPHPGIEVLTIAKVKAPITTAEGLTIVPDHSFATAPPLDILVVPSAEHSRDSDRANAELIAWVRTAGAQAKFVVSLCWGAFILAEAGLLDHGFWMVLAGGRVGRLGKSAT